jgi:hypothetical protein
MLSNDHHKLKRPERYLTFFNTSPEESWMHYFYQKPVMLNMNECLLIFQFKYQLHLLSCYNWTAYFELCHIVLVSHWPLV